MSETTEYLEHYSVMKEEVLNFFETSIENPLYADMTFGRGGHTFALAKKNVQCKVFSVDQDPEAYANGLLMIKEAGLEERVRLFKTNFENFKTVIDKGEISVGNGFDGILMDLGVSSHHFDSPERGFSFRFEAELDMRMANDDESVQSARDIVNNYSEEELELIFKEYGEERFSSRIASNIVTARSEKEIETTKDLETIIFHSYPKKMRYGKIHPATKCFQALRIAVNRELDVLKNSIEGLVSLLSPGGKLAIISFHSLEDRIVKRAFRELAPKYSEDYKILTKRPLVPTEDEIKENSRSRSAKLRILEKL